MGSTTSAAITATTSSSWRGAVNNAFDKRADITRFAQCREEMCTKPYIVTNRPRTIGVKFGQKF